MRARGEFELMRRWTFSIQRPDFVKEGGEWFWKWLNQLPPKLARTKCLLKREDHFGMALLDNQVLFDTSQQPPSFNGCEMPMPDSFLFFRCWMDKSDKSTEMPPKPCEKSVVGVAYSNQSSWRFSFSQGERNAAFAVKNARCIASYFWRQFQDLIFSGRVGRPSDSGRTPHQHTGSAIRPRLVLRSYLTPWTHRLSDSNDLTGFGFQSDPVFSLVLATTRKAITLTKLFFGDFAARAYRLAFVFSRHEITISRLA